MNPDTPINQLPPDHFDPPAAPAPNSRGTASTSDARKRQAEKDAAALHVGDRVWFDGKKTRWLVRGITEDGRYVVATASLFGDLAHTVIDESADIRGATNLMFPMFGIKATSGPDEGIDELLSSLAANKCEISHRNRVPLNITRHEKGQDA